MGTGAILASLWETMGAVLTVLTPLAAVPLTIITFYLRSLREQQVAWHAERTARLADIEVGLSELRRSLADFERGYTTKEEWIREHVQVRRRIEQMSERIVRLDAIVRGEAALHGGGSSGTDEGGRGSVRRPAAARAGEDGG